MAVYRFRLTFDEHEDVYREIEILGKQTFEEFHRAIQEAISFDNSKEASFFMSDDFWRKGQEIAMKAPQQDDDDEDNPKSKKKSVKLMSKCRIADFIDDPHQKILYLFDPEAKWTLLLELAKILTEEPKANYPRCSKSVGVAPKQYKPKVAPPPEEEDDEEDEEDKKAKEKVFTAVEEFDKEESAGHESEEEVHSADTDEEESGGDAEGDEGSADDFEHGEFGTDEL